MKKILVTGAAGQLGRCIHGIAANYPNFDIVFTSKNELDIENFKEVSELFDRESFEYCINTAAYTNVEKAESEPEKAFSINAEAVQNLAKVCKKTDTVLIHISTDYVFDGKKKTPYTEEDKTNPINVYGASKLKGEAYIEETHQKHFIIRTSWLYSQYGHNFYRTVLKFGKEGKILTVTTEQIGTPTNANDLATILLKIIDSGNQAFGIYHFSNGGETTWHGFAEAIFELNPQFDARKLVKTAHYPTFAKRPKNSVLDNSKFYKYFRVKPTNWKSSVSLIET
jgi:dTDP-4-dehydrorhamnose reductase